ncbi:MAG: hypothetical protein U0163_02900 [Gemmatimonadaceae bacterium]
MDAGAKALVKSRRPILFGRRDAVDKFDDLDRRHQDAELHMAQATTQYQLRIIANQQKIIGNQRRLLQIVANQANRQDLREILSNQKKILANQRKLMAK